ncbi:MAG: biotin/lipoyl-containing protein [Armatimonadota bacterium]
MAVTISIYHAPRRCAKCERMEEMAREVAASFPGRVEIVLTPVDEAPAELGVIMPPSMAVEGQLVAVGRLPNKQDVAATVAEALGGEQPTGAAGPGGSAFGHGRAVVEGERVYVCAEDFSDRSGCQPMLLFWYVDEGDAVEEGQELAEVESAKAVFVIESPSDGVLEEILVTEGQTIEPNQRLAALRAV